MKILTAQVQIFGLVWLVYRILGIAGFEHISRPVKHVKRELVFTHHVSCFRTKEFNTQRGFLRSNADISDLTAQVQYFPISVRTVHRLIEEGNLKRTKIQGCLRITLLEMERYEKELEQQMAGL